MGPGAEAQDLGGEDSSSVMAEVGVSCCGKCPLQNAHTGHRSRRQEAELREYDVGELEREGGKRQVPAPDSLLSFCVYAPGRGDHPCRHALGTQNLYFGDEG